MEPIGRGPKNTDRRPQHVKAKAKASQGTLDLLRTPSRRGGALPLANKPEVINAGEHAPASTGELHADGLTDHTQERSQGTVAAAPNPIKCMARVWGDGSGGQCKSKRKDGNDYCGKHADEKDRQGIKQKPITKTRRSKKP